MPSVPSVPLLFPGGGSGPASRRASPRGDSNARNYGGTRRLAAAARNTLCLWREETPRSLLHQLLYGAAQLLDASSSVMLYVADPWLRNAMREHGADNDDDAGDAGGGKVMRRTVFYLSGKLTVHGYRRDGRRPEPPRFASLAVLPIRGAGSVLALPLQAGPGQPVLAALQATAAPAEDRATYDPLWSGVPGGRECEEMSVADGFLSLSDGQIKSLELLCSTAAGILDMRRRMESVKSFQARTTECLEIVAKVHSAPHLVEFEQRAKTSMTKFFNVACARIVFYSAATRELMAVATRAHCRSNDGTSPREPKAVIGRQIITRISIQDGVVGRCVRRKEIFHLDPIVDSPFLSEAADGVEVSGQKGQINMLAGPLVADLSDDTSKIVGVLQLIQKRPPEVNAAGGKSGDPDSARRSRCEVFTDEDQRFFAELLRVLGLAAYRTMQIQSRNESSPDEEISIERLLGAV